jgi:prepilin-type N-terminal cleavage/methylation domain-containing protein
MKSFQKGFTLIELLVVISIIGILAGILFVAINPKGQNDKAKNAKMLVIANQEQKEAMLCHEGLNAIDCSKLSYGECDNTTITNDGGIETDPTISLSYAADCGFRPNSSTGFCQSSGDFPVDFETARNFCENNGGRLCLLEELPLTMGSGCSHDNYKNWTTSICSEGNKTGVWVEAGNNTSNTGLKSCETDLTVSAAYISCCSDD